jgi:hypothetical protein
MSSRLIYQRHEVSEADPGDIGSSGQPPQETGVRHTHVMAIGLGVA